jgi:hypothetical protein
MNLPTISQTTFIGWLRILVLIAVLGAWLIGKVDTKDAGLALASFLGVLGSIGLMKSQDSE